jgi:hypothetical protein
MARYFTENLEIVFKSYMLVFQKIYDKYKESDTSGGHSSYLTCDGFTLLCRELGVLDEVAGKRLAYGYFHKAMIP